MRSLGSRFQDASLNSQLSSLIEVTFEFVVLSGNLDRILNGILIVTTHWL